MKHLEDIVENQQCELARQRLEIERVQAARECENLINKLEHYAETGRWDDVANLFALKTPGVSAEELGFDGYEGGKAVWEDWALGHKSGWRPGFLCVNTTTTTVVEVAKDCQTAKMVFVSPGIETSERSGKWQAYWIWCKLGVDFTKEDGKWKIWHYHVYGIFTTPYEKSWTEGAKGSPMQDAGIVEGPMPDGAPPGVINIKPNKKSTHPVWWWSSDKYNDTVPAPPEPYETFNNKTAY